MADPIVIQCPTCSKKFKLPGKPPAVFTCTGCSTPMDLSGFRAAAPAEAPAPKARDSAKTGMAGRSASKVAARGAAARLRRKRTAEDAGDDGEDAPRGAPPKKDNSQMLIIGSLVGLVVIGGLALVLFQKKKGRDETAAAKALADADAIKRKAAEDEAAANAAVLHTGSKPAAGTPPAASGTPAAGTATGGAGTGTAGAGTGSGTPAMDAPPPPPPSKGGFHAVDHHPDATADEKAKIDELIQKAVFENAGRDSLLAGDDLVKFGVKASPRLINVFNTVKNAEGFGDRIGKSKVSVADKLLRRIDGYQERKKHSRQPITAASDEKYADSIAKAWTLWWDKEIWKSAPEKPWDERVDGAEEEARKNGGEIDKGGTPDGGK